MKKFIFLFFSILAVLGPSPSGLFGQETNADTEDQAFKAKLTGVAIGGKVSDLYILSGGDYEEVDFYVGVRSKSIRYAGPRSLNLYTQETGEDGETLYRSVAATELRGNASDYLLFVSKDSEKIRIFSLPEDLSSFPYGSFRFVNLTKKNIAMKLGDSKTLIKPNDSADVDGGFEHGKSYQTLMLELPANGDPAKPLFSSQIYFNENMRMLYLISADGDSSRIRLTGIPQKKSQ